MKKNIEDKPLFIRMLYCLNMTDMTPSKIFWLVTSGVGIVVLSIFAYYLYNLFNNIQSAIPVV